MSSSEDEGAQFVQYKDRAQWQDVMPVPQEDGGNGEVVAIMYTEDYRSTMDYFRAVMRSREISDRVFDLTSDCLMMNAANYTVWHYRRKCLKELNLDMEKEFDFVEMLAMQHPKNYQLWFHRQAIVDLCNHPGDAEREDRFTRKALMHEPKNYHAWGYRQWFIKKFNMMDKELEYVDELLKIDVRNNSAWSHRHFVVANTCTFDAPGVRGREIAYAIAVIRRTPNNESAWNYLRGCLLGSTYAHFPEIEAVCTELRSKHVPSPFIAETLVAIFEEQIKDDKSNVTKALELLKELAQMDTIREKYWQHKIDQLPVALDAL